MAWKISVGILAFLIFSMNVQAGIFDPVKLLADRRVSWLEPYLRFEKIKPANGRDIFELSSSGNKVLIAASDVNSAAMGLNWYLEYYCHRSMSHLGDNLSPIFPIPEIKKKVRVVSPFKYRYALNYCTLNYTMSFYSWKDWQWELDWMALHGVNLMLASIGTEAVWQKALEKFGFSDQEIKAFIPGPAFNAWWLMGNLEGWGGPVTQRMIDRRTRLEQKILRRMRELGIKPVLQGFYGMVPRALKKHFPGAAIRSQGIWVGAFERPDMLLPEDPLFGRMAKAYYEAIKKLYGEDIHFFGGDPFHEGGITKGIDITRAGRLIQSNMQRSFPGSTWVLQGWWDNPRKDLLEGVDKSKILVLALAGEQSNAWETRHGFEHTPFIWCTVNNFGGRSGLYGRLQFFADEVDSIRNGPYKPLCKGIGIMPEGILNNPVDYDLMLELGWHTQRVNVGDWIKKYVYYRYGSDNDTLEKAWQIFLQTIYRNIPQRDKGLPGNIFCARPAWGLKEVSTGSLRRDYDTHEFVRGVKMFLSVYPSMARCKTYHIDAIDFLRQVLSNRGNGIYRRMEAAYRHQDSSSFKQYARLFLGLISLDDSLLSLSGSFHLNKWLDDARALGKTSYEKKLLEWDARAQISYWGPDNPQTGLHDYANRDWSGLMRTLYLVRWKHFIEYSLEELRGGYPKSFDYFKYEYGWAHRTGVPHQLNIPERDARQLIDRALAKQSTL